MINAVIKTESDWNVDAVRYEPFYKWFYKVDSYAVKLRITLETCKVMQQSSYGLMQVMGAVGMEEGVDNPIDLLKPEVNILTGCRRLAKIRKKWGDDPLDIYAAYNAGSVRKTSEKKYYVNQSAVTRFKRNYFPIETIW